MLTVNSTSIQRNMLKIVLLVLALVPLVRPDCGVGEVFTTCGTACEDTCDNYLDESRICTANCVTGCFCEEGKIRSEPDHRCVDKSECPVCGANQEYGCASVCPDTCDNYDAPRACIEVCRIGCLCSQGYVLANENSTECVHTSDCPGREGCGINEHYRTCGSDCPTTCLTREHEVACTRQCVTGCFCNDGLLLHEGECVSDTKCNQVLGIRQGDGAAVEKAGVLMVLASFLLVLMLLGL